MAKKLQKKTREKTREKKMKKNSRNSKTALGDTAAAHFTASRLFI